MKAEPTTDRMTIILSERPPVSIYAPDWPIVSNVQTPPSQVGAAFQLVVRRHKDGRHLVYGVCANGTTQKQGGFLVPTGVDAIDLGRMVRRCAGTIGASSLLADRCINELPPEAI